LNSLEYNINLLHTHILHLQPNYEHYGIDFLNEECKYIFSLGGKTILNSELQEVLNFIISFRIYVNCINEETLRFSDLKLEDLICVDFIKFKVINNNN
jgi:hypothetical protein